MQDELRMRQQLQIQKEIKDNEEKLIEIARDLIEKENDQCIHIYDKRPNDNGILQDILEENQIRNILNVALEANAIGIIEVFIKYQIGRSESNSKWKFNKFGLSLVKTIVKDGDIYELASQIISKLRLDDSHLNDIWLRLTRLYLGHMNRYFYYRKKTANSEEDN
ncbi:hypothetical protein GF312_03155 [Candidatus Poribacteria bacterium]|nr:hypothetical protein [Candidatus Poribacteria bacterium]